MIIEAHGGSGLQTIRRYEVRGTLAQQSATAVPFTLKISGENSRLDLPEKVFVKRGRLAQWGETGKPRLEVRESYYGSEEIFLLPIFLVSQLSDQEFKGSTQGALRFEKKVPRRTFIGYNPPGWIAELSFGATTGLLQQATFRQEMEERPSIVIAYSEYSLVNGVAVPRSVTKSLSGRPFWKLTIESVTFVPSFPESDLEFQKN